MYLIHNPNARAVIYKRWIAAHRHWIVLIFEVLAMALVAVCTFSSIFIYGKNYELEPLTFNLSQLHTVDAFVELFSEEEDVKDMHAYYTELLYWYDAHVATLTKNRHNAYALLTQNQFTAHVNSRYIFGATFDQKIVTAWFNNIPLHSAPYALNVVHNAVARWVLVCIRVFSSNAYFLSELIIVCDSGGNLLQYTRSVYIVFAFEII